MTDGWRLNVKYDSETRAFPFAAAVLSTTRCNNQTVHLYFNIENQRASNSLNFLILPQDTDGAHNTVDTAEVKRLWEESAVFTSATGLPTNNRQSVLADK